MPSNFALTIAYDGTHFFGWQKNGVQRSVEEVLEKALQELLGHSVILQAASRTDANVHADGQVINFFTDRPIEPRRFLHYLRTKLPADLTALECKQMPDAFHPTISSVAKIYRYLLDCNHYIHPLHRYDCWHYPYPLNLDRMLQAAKILIGEKDFRSFRNRRTESNDQDTIREVKRIDIIEESKGRFHFEIEGNRFLYKMVRNLVGTIVYAGRGKILVDAIPGIIEEKKRENAGITAPAHGLRLHKVLY